MRILFNSRDEKYKMPFGALKTEQVCFFNILVPKSCPAEKVFLVLEKDGGNEVRFEMYLKGNEGNYNRFNAEISVDTPGLYFYWFYIKKQEGGFRLFRQESCDTNMEWGEKWQLTVYDKAYIAPDWAKGAVIYQIFPDRFNKCGDCDLSDKIKPYKIHLNTTETPDWYPDEKGNWNSDFYGGNLKGIIEKLDYLIELGVDIIYLNPIVKAASNHRYDTADYKSVDPMLGDIDQFRLLCDEAHKKGIKVIIDGVFSHTGSDSIYFKDAVENANSSYRDWYDFYDFPTQYRAWWGIKTLPQIKRNHPGFIDYIISNDDSVVDFWLGLGADGIRLDVADELTDEFIMKLRNKAKTLKSDCLVMGEVWEDASGKISYGERRGYLYGNELDSVMNYPFLFAICGFVKGEKDATRFANEIMTIVENYPFEMLMCCMNMLSSHDTIRIMTLLGTKKYNLSKDEKALHRLSEKEKSDATSLVKIAAFLQFTLPGAPSIYYGDEIGMEGFEDPFNRRYFEWYKIGCELQKFFEQLCSFKHDFKALRYGNITFHNNGDVLIFNREFEDEAFEIIVNLTDEPFNVVGDLVFSENYSNGQICKNGFVLIKNGTE